MPAMLWQHDADKPIGVWTEMVEDEKGLRIRASSPWRPSRAKGPRPAEDGCAQRPVHRVHVQGMGLRP